MSLLAWSFHSSVNNHGPGGEGKVPQVSEHQERFPGARLRRTRIQVSWTRGSNSTVSRVPKQRQEWHLGREERVQSPTGQRGRRPEGRSLHAPLLGKSQAEKVMTNIRSLVSLLSSGGSRWPPFLVEADGMLSVGVHVEPESLLLRVPGGTSV